MGLDSQDSPDVALEMAIAVSRLNPETYKKKISVKSTALEDVATQFDSIHTERAKLGMQSKKTRVAAKLKFEGQVTFADPAYLEKLDAIGLEKSKVNLGSAAQTVLKNLVKKLPSLWRGIIHLPATIRAAFLAANTPIVNLRKKPVRPKFVADKVPESARSAPAVETNRVAVTADLKTRLRAQSQVDQSQSKGVGTHVQSA